MFHFVRLSQVLRLLTDRLTVVENRNSSMSQQLDERGRVDAELIRKLQVQTRELQENHSSFVRDVGGTLSLRRDLTVLLPGT